MGDWDWSNFTSADKIGKGFENAFGVGSADPSNADRQGLRDQTTLLDAQAGTLNQQGANQAGFGQQGQANYNAMTGQVNQSADALRALANGQNSVSQIQLAQAAAANNAAQRSVAAGASPNNSAMAARIAANNQARTNTGLAGQSAVAGQAERNAATSQLSNLLSQTRGQDANVALGAGQNATNAYGQAAGAYGSAANAYGTALQHPQKGADVGAIAPELMAMAASDKRLKKDVEDGDDDAKNITKQLRAFAYKYKDEKYGKGKQFGPMAQDLEKAGLKHTVVDTPSGKMVHGAKAALSSLGLVAALGRRVEKLEKLEKGSKG